MFDECPFDGRDLSECPGPSCSAYAYNKGRASHKHCSVDGEILYEVGERGNYEDESGKQARVCEECQEPVCSLHERAHPTKDGQIVCRDCDQELVNRAQETDCADLVYAMHDINERTRKVQAETDSETLRSARSLLPDLRRAVDNLDRAITMRVLTRSLIEERAWT